LYICGFLIAYTQVRAAHAGRTAQVTNLRQGMFFGLAIVINLLHVQEAIRKK
jgi:hypothetical protein